jgi:hypothetical protein
LERAREYIFPDDDVPGLLEDIDRAIASLAQSPNAAQRSPVQEALDLAVNIIMANEPGHSCAVSNEAVALAAVSVGDTSAAVMKVIRDALAISSAHGASND